MLGLKEKKRNKILKSLALRYEDLPGFVETFFPFSVILGIFLR